MRHQSVHSRSPPSNYLYFASKQNSTGGSLKFKQTAVRNTGCTRACIASHNKTLVRTPTAACNFPAFPLRRYFSPSNPVIAKCTKSITLWPKFWREHYLSL